MSGSFRGVKRSSPANSRIRKFKYTDVSENDFVSNFKVVAERIILNQQDTAVQKEYRAEPFKF
jgi:predicted alpha/beta hydrolase